VDLTVVIPTYREAVNLPILLPQLDEVLSRTGLTYEILVVDDRSDDGTDRVVQRQAERMRVRLIVREGPRDLSRAVLDGFRAARGRYLLVMDADLSHPPESIPAMLAALDRPGADFVIGSRYVAAGRTEAWGPARRWNSLLATWLCRPLVGRVRDPMAGFFALRRDMFEQAVGLDPIGYKIGLELLCRCPCRRVLEIPITFRDRAAGQSKLDFEQQRRYLVHLDRLYRDCRPGVGLFIRPLLWAMRTVLAVAQRLQVFLARRNKDLPVRPVN